jgi:hypothetical protein
MLTPTPAGMTGWGIWAETFKAKATNKHKNKPLVTLINLDLLWPQTGEILRFSFII